MKTITNFFEENEKDQYLPAISLDDLSDQEVLVELEVLHREMADQVIVLGHHYQSDEIIRYADITGDSLALAKKAVDIDKPYILFCGVHFMAETADILARPDQKVILPDLNAGCSMADMADDSQVRQAWEFILQSTKDKVVPITYINCDAKLKSFVGENGGSICTSSNAQKVIEWAFTQGKKLLFFPDQHLGRNTCFKMGVKLEEMVVYNPKLPQGGLTSEQVAKAKVILWYGYCSVHQGFSLDHIHQTRKHHPKMRIIVHPECSFDVVQAADEAGSTQYIIKQIEASPSGSEWAVGTEINLVNRLANKYPDKKIISLSPYQCLCTTMYRVRPRWLLASYRAIKANKPINVIKVNDHIKQNAVKALNQMLSIS
jgi:quinolinate synthase